MPPLRRAYPVNQVRRLLEYRDDNENFAIRVIAGTVLLNGLAAISEVLFTRISPAFESLVSLSYESYGRTFGLFAGLALIYISSQLLLRKHLAWVVATGGSAAVIAAHIFYFHTEAALLLPMTTLVLLIVYQKEFVAGSEPASMRQGIKMFLISLAVALIYGTIGFSRMLPHDFYPPQRFSLSQGFDRTIREFVLIGNDDLHARTRTAKWFVDSLDLLGAASATFAIYSLFRPLRYRYSTLPSERLRAAELLDRYGNSSEDSFKLWPEDKAFFFLDGGESFLVYLVQAGAAVVLGEPVGPVEQWPRLIASFQDFCRHHDWLVTFVYLPKERLDIFETAGLRSVKIGEDAIVETETFRSKTGRNKHFRAVRNKFVRLGYRYEVSEAGTHSPQVIHETALVNRSWLGRRGRKERGFALGSYERRYIEQTKLHLLYDNNGKLVAFANQIRSYNQQQATIDLMRHRINTETGVMDYLLLRIIELQAELGIPEFSLGLAPLSGLVDDATSPVEQRFLRFVAMTGFGGFSYDGLRKYKNKFEPRWEPRFMAYGNGAVGFLRSGSALSSIAN